MQNKKLLIGIVALIVIAVGVWFFFLKGPVAPADGVPQDGTATTTADGTPIVPGTPNQPGTPAQPVPAPADGSTAVLGQSADGTPITVYHYGEGEREVLVIGGIHGGYSANTVLVARDIMNWLDNSPQVIPDNVRVSVIPLMNPDGLKEVVGTTGTFTSAGIPAGDRSEGRFNGNGVDLNRNFDCEWSPTGFWQNRQVSGGDKVFSEPETQAVRAYIERTMPQAVVVYYSAAGEVFSSRCNSPMLMETRDLTREYAKASGYTPHETFDYYEINGDMANWIARIGVPAISVLLSNHTDSEWTKNQRGMTEVLKYVSEDTNPNPEPEQ